MHWRPKNYAPTVGCPCDEHYDDRGRLFRWLLFPFSPYPSASMHWDSWTDRQTTATAPRQFSMRFTFCFFKLHLESTFGKQWQLWILNMVAFNWKLPHQNSFSGHRSNLRRKKLWHFKLLYVSVCKHIQQKHSLTSDFSIFFCMLHLQPIHCFSNKLELQ